MWRRALSFRPDLPASSVTSGRARSLALLEGFDADAGESLNPPNSSHGNLSEAPRPQGGSCPARLLAAARPGTSPASAPIAHQPLDADAFADSQAQPDPPQACPEA